MSSHYDPSASTPPHRSPRRLPLSRRGIAISRFSDPQLASERVEDITLAIDDANQNLRSIDHLIQDYSQIHSVQSDTIHKLKSDLETNHEQLRSERLARSHLTQLSSRNEASRLPLVDHGLRANPPPVIAASDSFLPPNQHPRIIQYSNQSILPPHAIAVPNPVITHSLRPTDYSQNPHLPHPHLPPSSLPGSLHVPQPSRTVLSGNERNSHRSDPDFLADKEDAHKSDLAKWRAMKSFMEDVKEKTNSTKEEINENLDKRLGDIERALKTSRVLPTKSQTKSQTVFSARTNSSKQMMSLRKSASMLSIPGSESGASAVLDNISTELRNALKEEEDRKKANERLLEKEKVSSAKAISNGLENPPLVLKDDPVLNAKLRQKENEKQRLQETIEIMKREMDQIRGGEGYFVSQIEDLEIQCQRLKEERNDMMKQMEEWKAMQDDRMSKERREKIIETNSQDQLVRENQTLKEDVVRLKQSVGGFEQHLARARTSNESRESLEVSLANLQKELRDKEASLKDSLQKRRESELAETTAKENAEEAFGLADAMKKSMKKLEEEKDHTESELQESKEKTKALVEKYEEMKGKAHEAIRQWKGKVKKTENDHKCSEEINEQLRNANNELVREVEKCKSELATSNERGERLLTEVESLGEIRARFEEQLRIMEVQYEENRSESMEKEASFKEMREEHEMLQAEVIELRAKVKEGRAERTMLEDRLKDSSTDVTKLDRERTRLDQLYETLKQENEEKHERVRDLEATTRNTERHNKEVKNELTRLETVLNEERQKAESTIENLQRESKELRKNERCREQDLGSKFRQSNSEIESLKLELAETSASLSTCLKNSETLEQNLLKFKNENEQINEEFVHVKKTNKILGEKLERRDQSENESDERLKSFRLTNEELKQNLQKKDREMLELFRAVDTELDEIVILASRCSTLQFSSRSLATVTPSISNGDALLKALKPKIKWLSEVMAYMGNELNEVKSNLVGLHHDKESLNQKLKDEKDRLERSESAHANQVKSMETKFRDLSSYIEVHAERDIHHMQTLIDNANSTRETFSATPRVPAGSCEISPRIKDEIERRYQSYKRTVDELQRDLIEVANATPRIVYAPSPSPTVMRSAPMPWTSTPSKP